MRSLFWLSLGFIGQFLFGLRMFIQWRASEKAKRSVIPSSFWTISLIAGVCLFAYAVWRKDYIFMLNEGLCLMIFMRNFMLMKTRPL